MISIKMTAKKGVLRQGWSTAVHEYLATQIRQAAREFVREAVKHIPIDTGQARGTLLPLARVLRVAVDISGAKPLSNKNQETGSSTGNKLIFKFTRTKNSEGFQVDVQLLYFWINDIMGHPSGEHSPWESIEQGWEAFLLYMKEQAPKRYPKISSFIEHVDFDGASVHG